MTKKKPLSELEKKYLKLAEVYIAKYEDMSYRNIQIMLAKGVIVDMESDLAFFHLNKPRTDKSQLQIERLDILRNVVSDFADMHSVNWQIHRILGEYHRENQELIKKIAVLEESVKELILKKDLDEQ